MIRPTGTGGGFEGNRAEEGACLADFGWSPQGALGLKVKDETGPGRLLSVRLLRPVELFVLGSKVEDLEGDCCIGERDPERGVIELGGRPFGIIRRGELLLGEHGTGEPLRGEGDKFRGDRGEGAEEARALGSSSFSVDLGALPLLTTLRVGPERRVGVPLGLATVGSLRPESMTT